MTLIEILIASGISVVVSLGIAGIYIFAIQQFTILVNMNTAQENVLWMAYHTKNTLSQAVNITTPGAPVAAPACAATNCVPSTGSATGCIANHTSASDGSLQTVATFQREWSTGVTASELLPTAIFFRRPTANVEGRVTFDINTPVGLAIAPGNDDIFYDQVVQYDTCLTSESIYSQNQATGVVVTITTRYHRSSAENRRWCVPGDTAANCIDGVSASDITMRFNVGLRNNRALEKTGTQSRSIHGGIYYYRFIPPLFRDVQ